MNGNVSGVSQYIDPSLFKGFEGSIQGVQNVIKNLRLQICLYGLEKETILGILEHTTYLIDT